MTAIFLIFIVLISSLGIYGEQFQKNEEKIKIYSVPIEICNKNNGVFKEGELYYSGGLYKIDASTCKTKLDTYYWVQEIHTNEWGYSGEKGGKISIDGEIDYKKNKEEFIRKACKDKDPIMIDYCKEINL